MLRERFEGFAALTGARPAAASCTLDAADLDELGLLNLIALEDRGTGRRVLTPDLAISLLLDARAEGMFRAETNLRFVISGTEWRAQGDREVLRLVMMRDPEPFAFLELALTLRDFLASLGIADVAACLHTGAEDAHDDYHVGLVAMLNRNFARFENGDATDALLAPRLEIKGNGALLGTVERLDSAATRIAGEPCAAVSAYLDVTRVLATLGSASPLFVAGQSPKVLVAYYDSGIVEEALALAMDLRREGIAALFLHGAKNLGKHFRQAERFGVEWVVIVGGREWDNGEVAIRSATSREEVSVPRSGVAAALREQMNRA